MGPGGAMLPSLATSGATTGLGVGGMASSSSSPPFVELPITEDSQWLVGFIGMLVAGLVALGSFYRLIRFMKLYGWNMKEVFSTPFGRKRLGIHVLVFVGTLFALALYALLLVLPPTSSSSSSSSPAFCIGLVALQRFQFLCVFGALGLILSEWRIDVYEAPLLTRSRLALYRLRDGITGLLLAVSFLLNATGPLLCLKGEGKEGGKAASYGGKGGSSDASQAWVLNAAYILQVLCALMLMSSMLYSGLQMKTRLLWASRSPLRQNDIFRVALRQLDGILIVCTASFISQVTSLLFNYTQLVILHHLYPWSPLLVWSLAVWLPSIGWSASCLYLARKARRQSFVGGVGGGGGNNTPRSNNYQQVYVHDEEYVQALMSNRDEEGEGGAERAGDVITVSPPPPLRKQQQRQEGEEEDRIRRTNTNNNVAMQGGRVDGDVYALREGGGGGDLREPLLGGRQKVSEGTEATSPHNSNKRSGE